MADAGNVGAVNGEARTRLATIEERIAACREHHKAEGERNDRDHAAIRADNTRDHDEVFERLRGLEVEVGKLGVRMGMWAAGGSLLAGVIIQFVTKLLSAKAGGG